MGGITTWETTSGGRFTSLKAPDGFEWLWSNPRGDRTPCTPAAAFVDAGGAEECFPTVAGDPDHGSLWSQEWTAIDSRSHSCSTPDARFTRSIDTRQSEVVLRYRVEAEPGYRFIWAFHALVTPAAELTIDASAGETVLNWPNGYEEPAVSSEWPRVGSVARFDDMTTDDGTARFALLPDRSAVTIRIGARSLTMTLDAPSAPTAIGLWRNLGGYAWDGGDPYRSIGIEPMLGRNPMLSAQAEAAVVPSSGLLEWELSLRFHDPTTQAGDST